MAQGHSSHHRGGGERVGKAQKRVKLPYEESKLTYRFPIGKKSQGIDAKIQKMEKRVSKLASMINLNSLANAYLHKARQTGDLKYYEKAKWFATRSLKRVANESALLALAEIEQAEHHFAKALDIIKSLNQNAEAMAIRVKVYLGMGKKKEALKEANKMVERLPLMGSYIYLGTVHEALGHPVKATHLYYKALNVEDVGQEIHSAWVRSLLARLYLRHGNKNHAEKAIGAALKIIPTYPMAKFLKGMKRLSRAESFK